MLDSVRKLIPSPVKKRVREVLDKIDAVVRMRDLKACVRELKDCGEEGADEELITRCWRAWGNEGWSADVSFVQQAANRAASGSKMLDCGSGLTTIVAAALSHRRGGEVWSLEQDESWVHFMSGVLEKLGINNVHLIYAPLKSYGEYAWYDVEEASFAKHFDYIFCDGPAVLARDWEDPVYSNWRSGLIPQLKEKIVSYGEILLDDGEDKRCSQLLNTWSEQGVSSEAIETSSGMLVVAKPSV